MNTEICISEKNGGKTLCYVNCKEAWLKIFRKVVVTKTRREEKMYCTFSCNHEKLEVTQKRALIPDNLGQQLYEEKEFCIYTKDTHYMNEETNIVVQKSPAESWKNFFEKIFEFIASREKVHPDNITGIVNPHRCLITIRH